MRSVIHRGKRCGVCRNRGSTARLRPYGVDAAYADRADALAAQSVPVVRTNLLDRSDRLRRMLRSRGVS
ncbi:hypothetical protein GCM10029976_096290 [Kribbella albertanoniae]